MSYREAPQDRFFTGKNGNCFIDLDEVVSVLSSEKAGFILYKSSTEQEVDTEFGQSVVAALKAYRGLV